MFVAPGKLTLWAGFSDLEQRVEAVELHAGNRLLGVVRVSSVDLAADELTLRHREHPELGRVRLVTFEWNEPPPGLHELWVLARNQTEPPSRSPVSRITLWPADRVPVVTEAAMQATGSEGRMGADDLSEPEPEPIVFSIEREGPLIAPLTVFSALGRTAVNGVDYEQVPTSVTLPEGARSVEITMMPIDDDWLEGPETVVLRLVPLPLADLGEADEGSYRVGPADMAQATIRDADVAPNLAPRAKILLPVDGQTFVVPAQVEVEVLTLDPDGYVTRVEPYAGDEKIGEDGLVFIHPPPPGCYMVGTPAKARAVILDRPVAQPLPPRIELVQPKFNALYQAPTVRIIACEPPRMTSAHEGMERAPVFLVTRSGATEQPLTVYYRVGGTAVSGQDYAELPGSLTIASGQHSARLVVRPLDLRAEDQGRTVRFCLVPSPVMGPIDPYQVGDPGCAAAFMTEPTRFRGPLARLPDGTVHTALPGDEGEVYRLEVSRGLDEWEPVADITAVDGSVRFLDAAASDQRYRFYRLRPVVPEVLEGMPLPSRGSW